jgi:hypothetical protein
MVVVYVPIDPDNKSLLEQQKKFLDEMLKKRVETSRPYET